MTNINKPDVEPIDYPGRDEKVDTAQKSKARRVDWLLIFLVLGGFLAVSIAIAVGLALLLAPPLGVDLQNLRIRYSPLSFILDNLNLLQFGLLLLICLLVLAPAFYWLTRWRVLQNRFLWPAAGCPSCGNEDLRRVKRRDRDHLYDWIGIPVGRYYCSACSWNNLRIRRGPNIFANKDDWSQVAAPKRGKSALLAGSNPATDSNWDGTSEAAAGSAQIKWATRLSSPVDLTTFEDDQGIEEAMPPFHGPESATNESESMVEESASTTISPTYATVSISQPGEAPEAKVQELTVDDTIEAEKISIEISAPPGLKLRADPQLDGAMLSVLELDTQVLLLIELTAEDGSAWQQLQTDEQQGWVLRSFLKNSD